MALGISGFAAGAAALGRQVNLGIKTAGAFIRSPSVPPHLTGMMQRLKNYDPAGLTGMLSRANLFGWTTPSPHTPAARPTATPASATTPASTTSTTASTTTAAPGRPPPLPPRRPAHPLQSRFRQDASAAQQPAVPAAVPTAAEQPPHALENEERALVLARPPREEETPDMSQALVPRPSTDIVPAQRPAGDGGAAPTHTAPHQPQPATPQPATPQPAVTPPHRDPAQGPFSPLLSKAMHKVEYTLGPAGPLPPALAQQMLDIIGPRMQQLNDILAPLLAPFEAFWDAAKTGRHVPPESPGEGSWHALADAGESNALALAEAQSAPGQDPQHRYDPFHTGAHR